MENVAFVPLLILVEDGATVTWTNNDSVDHTVTAGTPEDLSELFDSGPLAPGETFTFTFEEPGTYVYFCTIHPGMVGSVVVQ